MAKIITVRVCNVQASYEKEPCKRELKENETGCGMHKNVMCQHILNDNYEYDFSIDYSAEVVGYDEAEIEDLKISITKIKKCLICGSKEYVTFLEDKDTKVKYEDLELDKIIDVLNNNPEKYNKLFELINEEDYEVQNENS